MAVRLPLLAENATPGGGGDFNITTSIEYNIIQIDNNGNSVLSFENRIIPGRQDVFNIGDNDFILVNGIFNSNVRKFDKKGEKYFICGGPLLFGNKTYRFFLKLNSDFTVDQSFNLTGAGFNNVIEDFHILNDGKIVVVGSFQFYDVTNITNRIARLNPDGSLDTTFNTTATVFKGFNDTVLKIKLTSDNKFLIGGQFNTYNGTTRNRVARLNLDGSLDTSFDPGTGFNGTVQSISVLSNGKIICVGDFTSYNGITTNRIAMLNTDGSLDTSFNVGTGFDSSVIDLTVTSNDKIVCVGNFLTYNEITSIRIARLNPDGTLDTTFNTGTGFNTGPTYVNSTENDNIFVAGFLSAYNK
jgi:uncharacterized delta-60 repeat protein